MAGNVGRGREGATQEPARSWVRPRGSGVSLELQVSQARCEETGWATPGELTSLGGGGDGEKDGCWEEGIWGWETSLDPPLGLSSPALTSPPFQRTPGLVGKGDPGRSVQGQFLCPSHSCLGRPLESVPRSGCQAGDPERREGRLAGGSGKRAGGGEGGRGESAKTATPAPCPYSELRGHSQFSAGDREPGPPWGSFQSRPPTQVRRLLGRCLGSCRGPGLYLFPPCGQCLGRRGGLQAPGPACAFPPRLSTSEALGRGW